ncbi:MAG TPA: adenosine deaminase [Bacteroidia bacterium]|nr:adenosine deaminase [Bacteroidia bacterium]
MAEQGSLDSFIQGIPKAELHVHIEGTFEPELMFAIAQRNQVPIRFASVAEVRQAYNFSNLQDFLDIYYEGANVLLHEQDFYDLTFTYLEKLHAQNVVHAEIFFDPQTHTDRGIPFATVIDGIWRACRDAEAKWGLTTSLIMCFLRHLDEASAFATLEQAMPYRDRIIGVGLDSSELGHPPSKFERVFARAAQEGLLLVAHAGEEGPAEYIWEALNLLNIARLDHGNRCLDDDKLVDELVRRQMALTVCPLSNLKLCVVKDLNDHSLKTMLDRGLLVTVNSDDPAYFGGGVNENYSQTAAALGLSKQDIYELARNSFIGSFLPEDQKQQHLRKIDTYYQGI